MNETLTDEHDAWVADTFDVDPRNSAAPADNAAPPVPDPSTQAGDPPADPPSADTSQAGASDSSAQANDPPASPGSDPAAIQTSDPNILASDPAPSPGSPPADAAQTPGGGAVPVSAPGGGTAQPDDAFDAAVTARDWAAAAQALDKLNSYDMQDRLAKLKTDDRAAIHKAAEQDPTLGPSSVVALNSAPPAKAAGATQAPQDPPAGNGAPQGPAGPAAAPPATASYGDALQKAAEAALQEFLKTPDGKALKEKAEKAVDDIPPVVKYGVAGTLVAAALAGLAATHQASPITKTPKIKLADIGGVGVSAEFTWKGPVDKPTETVAMFTLEIPLGKDPPKPKTDTSAGAAGPGPSGDNAPPLPQGPPALIANFDGKADVGKIMQELAKHTSADSGGQIIVVGYYVPQEAPTDDKPPTGERTDDAATARAAALKNAIGQQVDGSRYSVTSDIEFKVSGGRTFGLGGDASALGSHDTAVIFIPHG